MEMAVKARSFFQESVAKAHRVLPTSSSTVLTGLKPFGCTVLTGL